MIDTKTRTQTLMYTCEYTIPDILGVIPQH